MKSLSFKGKIFASAKYSVKSNMFRAFSTSNDNSLNVELVS